MRSVESSDASGLPSTWTSIFSCYLLGEEHGDVEMFEAMLKTKGLLSVLLFQMRMCLLDCKTGMKVELGEGRQTWAGLLLGSWASSQVSLPGAQGVRVCRCVLKSMLLGTAEMS